MMKIYKYGLKIQSGQQKIEMPINSKVLSVQNQAGEISVWAEVVAVDIRGLFEFNLIPTGQDVGGTVGEYCGTVQLHGGELVFHIYRSKF